MGDNPAWRISYILKVKGFYRSYMAQDNWFFTKSHLKNCSSKSLPPKPPFTVFEKKSTSIYSNKKVNYLVLGLTIERWSAMGNMYLILITYWLPDTRITLMLEYHEL